MSTIDTYVHSITHAGTDMLSYELRPLDETTPLPPFDAGAHVDLHIAPGLIRQYSLCNDPAERHRYVVCVHRDARGRGGSRALHDGIKVGDQIRISAPRNHFALDPAPRYILIAGGIGVTPLAAMAHHLRGTDVEVHLHVYARDRSRIPLPDELVSGGLAECTTIHLSGDGDSIRATPPAGLVPLDADTLVYTCGPEGFMDTVAEHAVAAGYSEERIRRERFAPSATSVVADPASDGSFDVVVASTQQRVTVAADQSIAESLADHGIVVELSCEQGMCGACLTPVISGLPDHRDDVQSPAEHEANSHITVCCSRARSPELVLDL